MRAKERPADIYFVERHGNLKRYNGADNTVTLLSHFDVWSDSPEHVDSVGPEAETGLEAIVLDRDFATNHRLYLRYEPWEKEVYRIASFVVKGDSLDRASEKILLEIPYVREHTRLQAIVIGGSGMAMDDFGDLYIAIGANSELSPSVNEKYRDFSAEYTSSNLASLRGAILRIHPDDSPRGYSIPKGNFGEYFSSAIRRRRPGGPGRGIRGYLQGEAGGLHQRRAQSLFPERGSGQGLGHVGRVRPQPHGPHAHRGGQSGHPSGLWRLPLLVGQERAPARGVAPVQGRDPKAPVNNSVWNTGPKELPPTDTPRYAYSAYLNSGFIVGNHPTAGPIYRYDGKLRIAHQAAAPFRRGLVRHRPHERRARLPAERRRRPACWIRPC